MIFFGAAFVPLNELLKAPSTVPLNEAGNDSWSVSVSVVNFSCAPFFEDDFPPPPVDAVVVAKLSRECNLKRVWEGEGRMTKVSRRRVQMCYSYPLLSDKSISASFSK